MPRIVTAIAALGLAGLCATPSLAWLAPNQLRVDGPAEDFTVDYRPSNTMDDYWCAAGEYTINHLHLHPTTRIYRTTGSSPRAIGEMRFSVLADRASGDTGVVSIGRDDGGFTAAHAQAMCELTWPLLID
ncbi:hypothetical protein [Frigidibacter sp. MR17.24]|uniref:hypothetical protein n=1 Tax=Frigidibacter sp. MR17.24 TaxID=3127345 RepID=UPI003012D8FA